MLPRLADRKYTASKKSAEKNKEIRYWLTSPDKSIALSNKQLLCHLPRKDSGIATIEVCRQEIPVDRRLRFYLTGGSATLINQLAATQQMHC